MPSATNGWAQVTLADGYEGWMPAEGLGDPLPKDRAHVVVVPQAADRYLGTWLPAPGLRTEPLAAARRKASGEAISEAALMFLGAPYEWGGLTVEGLDCSGLVQAVHRRFGMLLPRNADQQETAGREVSLRHGGARRPGLLRRPHRDLDRRGPDRPREPGAGPGRARAAPQGSEGARSHRPARVRARRLIAYAAIDLESGRRVERNADVVMPAASTVKVLISAAMWCAVEEGALDAGSRLMAGEAPAPGGGGLLESLDRGTALTLADLDILMLAVSDNAATERAHGRGRPRPRERPRRAPRPRSARPFGAR